MIRDDFTIETATWDVDQADLRAVREQVFLIEQSIPPEDEWDALDTTSRHVIARDTDGQPIGTGRLTPEHDIGRMAVVAAWRGNGVGAAILRVLLEQACTLGYPSIELRAQSHAIRFYSQQGFEAHGEEFLECGIPHQLMRMDLTPLSGRAAAPLPPRPEPRILIVEDLTQAKAAIADLLAAARHGISIYTRDLDAALLDNQATLDAIKRIARSGPSAQVRILVHEPRKAVMDGHRLIALAQRLPSAIALRTPVDERDLQYPSAFIITDAGGYLFRNLGSRVEGEGSTYAPGRNAQLRNFFDQVWERSTPGADIRQLSV